MSTITHSQQKAIADILVGMKLPSGLGNETNACSLAAINLALSGRLTDDVPDCMSDVIGRWVISVQDAMPDEMRNSARWKDLLPRAAGTGRAHEKERLEIILDWMWSDVLPTCQPAADSDGFGPEWLRMTTARTAQSADAARAAGAAVVAWSAAEAAEEARAAVAARAAGSAARAAGAAAEADAARAWDRFDPCGLLQKLVEVSE